MLDVTTLLHNAEDLDLQLDSDYEVEMGADARLQNTFARLDIHLADLAETVGWTNIWQPQSLDQIDPNLVLTKYRQSLDSALLFAAKKKWTELLVFDADQYQNIVGADRLTETADLNREYLAIKHFFDNAYFMHRREDFRHGWHLLVKLGVTDLGLSEEKIVDSSNQHLQQYLRHN